MGKFEKLLCFIISTFSAFVLITSCADLGKTIGFEQMEELGVAFIFGALYMHLAVMNAEKKDKED